MQDETCPNFLVDKLPGPGSRLLLLLLLSAENNIVPRHLVPRVQLGFRKGCKCLDYSTSYFLPSLLSLGFPLPARRL